MIAVKPPGHRRRPVGGRQRGEIQGDRFRAGRERTQRVLPHHPMKMVPIGAVGAEGGGSFGGADERFRLIFQEPERRRPAEQPARAQWTLPGAHCSSASSAARSSSRARARASAGDQHEGGAEFDAGRQRPDDLAGMEAAEDLGAAVGVAVAFHPRARAIGGPAGQGEHRGGGKRKDVVTSHGTKVHQPLASEKALFSDARKEGHWHICAITCCNSPETKMPSPPQWFQHVDSALEALRAFPGPLVDRAGLEKLLRVSRRTAIRLMNHFGGYQAGKTFLIDRQDLIAALERVQTGESFPTRSGGAIRLADDLERTRRGLARPPSQAAGCRRTTPCRFPARRPSGRSTWGVGGGVCESGKSCWGDCMSW